MRLIIALFLSLFLIGCNFQNLYLKPVLVDDFQIPGEISAQGTSGASVQSNLGNETQILGTQRVLYSYLQGTTIGTSQDSTNFFVIPSNSSTTFGSIQFTTVAVRIGFGMILWDGLNSDAGNPCGSPALHLNNPKCQSDGCPLMYPGLKFDARTKDGFAFLLQNQKPPAGANFLFSLWTGSEGYAYSSYTYPSTVSNGVNAPEIFFAFNSLTVIKPIDLSNVMAFALEINTTNTNASVLLGHPQILGTTLIKSSNLNNVINPGQSVATVAPGTSVTFNVFVLPDIFELRLAEGQSVLPIQYNAVVTDTLPSQFSPFSASNPFTASVVTLTESVQTTSLSTLVSNVQALSSSPITTVSSGSGQVATASFNFTNPQGVTLTYTATTANSYNFCQQTVCNQANAQITTFGVNGNTVASKDTTYCVTLQGTPVLSTTYTTCPSTFTVQPVTNVSICNTGNGQANAVAFSQSYLTGCSFVSAVSPNSAVTCSGTTCSGNLGDLNPNTCVNVAVTFNCAYAQSSNTQINFGSSVTVSETCASSTSTASCNFVFSPGTPVLTATYTTCPTTFTPTPATVGQICNTGNATAKNVNFNQTVLPGCIASGTSDPSVNCNSGFCTGNIGDITAGNCKFVTVNFNCASYVTNCNVSPLSTSFNTKETFIGATASSGTCSLSTNPSLTVSVSETLENTVPAKIGETITWNIVGTNNGPATAQSYDLTTTIPPNTTPTTQTQSVWSCSAQTCTYTGPSSLTATSSSAPIPFSVVVSATIPLSVTQVCNNVTITTGPNAPNCVATAQTSGCAPVSVGTPDISVSKSAAATQYTFTIGYSSIGTGAVNDLVLYEGLQEGWTISEASKNAGWKCGDTTCLFEVGNVPADTTGSVLFIVNVAPSAQIDGSSTKCWHNLVTSTFNDEIYDPTPSNNLAKASIGSSCSPCCSVPSCPANICNVTCPDPNITVVAPCPKIDCTCDIPEYWCPPCQVQPASCSCSKCSKK